MKYQYKWIKIITIHLFLLNFPQNFNAQNINQNEQKVTFYKKKIDYFINKNIDSTVVYANKLLLFAEKNKLPLQVCDAYQTLGKTMYLKSNYNKALEYFNLQKKTAQNIKDSKAYVYAINNIANVMIDLGKTDEAEKIYQEVLDISKKNKDYEGVSRGYNNLAYIARMKGNNSKAIQYIYEKIKNDEKINKPENNGYSYQQLAVIYLRNSDWNNAQKNIDLSSDSFKKTNDERNLGINMQLRSVIYEGKGDYKNSINELKNALKISEKLQDKRTVAIIYNEIGRNYDLSQNPDEAETNYKKSLEIHKEINLQKTLPSLLISYGKSQLAQNKMSESKENFIKGLDLAKKMKSAINEKEAYDALSDWYIKNGDSDNAIKYKKEFLKMNDSLLNDKNNKLLSELNVKYETEKKENKINLLNSENKANKINLAKNKLQLQNNLLEINTQNLKIENQNLQLDKQNLEISNKNLEIHNNQDEISRQKQAIINKEQKIKLLDAENKVKKLEIEKKNTSLMVLLGSLFTLLLLTYLFYNRYKIKQEAKLQKEIIHQQDLATKAVMNAEDNERKRMATHLHDGVGQLLSAVNMNVGVLDDYKSDDTNFSKILERTKNILDEAMTDVRTLSHQIMPNMLIKNSLSNALRDLIEKSNSPKLHISLKMEGLKDNLDENIQIVMYRIIQECINNTIKHAEAKSVNISVIQNENVIKSEIVDDGIGFNPLKISSKSDGLGLENITSRIDYLKGKININSAEGKGTSIKVEIPL